jgi:hypothetical protein
MRARPARHPQEPPASPSSRSPLLNLEPPAFPNPRRGGATHSIRAPGRSHPSPSPGQEPVTHIAGNPLIRCLAQRPPKFRHPARQGVRRTRATRMEPSPGPGYSCPCAQIPSQPNGRLVPPSHELRHHFPFYRTPTLSTPTRRKQPASLARCTLHSPGRLDEATWKRGWKG